MSSELTIFLLFFGGLQGILFSFFLLRKKLQRAGYVFLFLYFLVMLLQITLKLMSKGWLMEHWHILYELSYQLPFLYGPMIYLFSRQLLQSESFKPADLLHFIPFAVTIFFSVLGNLYAESPVVLFPFLLVKSRLLLQLLSIYLYHWFALQCWNSHTELRGNFHSARLKWMKQFVYSSFLVCTTIAFLNFFMVIFYPDLDYVRPGFLVLTLFIYWISYEALYHPEIFSVIRGYGEEAQTNPDNIPKLTIHRPARKYVHSNLSDEEGARILAGLELIIRDRKPYLDSTMSIEKLAAMLDSNRHHLSQVLNEKLQKSFYDYINYYRVEEAKALLTNSPTNNHKIASIAYDAGFNSLSTFNDVFRKSTGLTPSQFRKQPLEISQKRRV